MSLVKLAKVVAPIAYRSSAVAIQNQSPRTANLRTLRSLSGDPLGVESSGAFLSTFFVSSFNVEQILSAHLIGCGQHSRDALDLTHLADKPNQWPRQR